MTVKDIKNKILVIDDELGVRESMRHLFKNEYEVLLADSVDKGVDLLRREKPDAIIMDIRMPEKNGIEALVEIKAARPETTVVMITANADADIRGSWAAMRRAAQRARQVAQQTGTDLIVVRAGRVVRVAPPPKADQ